MRSVMRRSSVEWTCTPAAVRGHAALAAVALAAFCALPGCSSANPEGAGPPAAEGTVKPATEETVPPVKETEPRIERVPDTEEPVPASGDADTSAVPAELLAAARADLEKRLAAENAAGPIRVLIAQAVTWNDGSLGCAQPGMNYTMALVPGYRVVFGVRGGAEERRYAYHSGRGGPLAYCANPGPPAAASSAI